MGGYRGTHEKMFKWIFVEKKLKFEFWNWDLKLDYNQAAPFLDFGTAIPTWNSFYTTLPHLKAFVTLEIIFFCYLEKT